MLKLMLLIFIAGCAPLAQGPAIPSVEPAADTATTPLPSQPAERRWWDHFQG